LIVRPLMQQNQLLIGLQANMIRQIFKILVNANFLCVIVNSTMYNFAALMKHFNTLEAMALNKGEAKEDEDLSSKIINIV
jgi:hypothetical protein